MRSFPALSVELAAALASICPRPAVLAAGRRLGDLTSILVQSRRAIALRNLHLALGRELNTRQLHQIMQGAFRQLGQNVVESFLLPKMLAAGLDRFTAVEGWHHLRDAVNGGRGVIVFTGHFGNWEMVALTQGARGIPMDVVGRPLGDQHLNRRLEKLRKLTGNGIIPKHNAFRPLLKQLRRGRVVGLVIDQNVGDGHGVYVDFFGRKAATTPALAMLALKTGAPVLPVFGYPEGEKHRIVYGPPVAVRRTDQPKEDIVQLTATVTQIIEKEVRRHPHLWLWMHNRWRSRPSTGDSGVPTDATSPLKQQQEDGLRPSRGRSCAPHS